MAIFRCPLTGGAEYDGVAAATGLFAPTSGIAKAQVRVNSIAFVTSGAISTWALAMRDPVSGASFPVDSGTTASFLLGGPAGFLILPTSDDGVPWQLTLVTTGIAGDSHFSVDYDLVPTEQ